MLCSVATGLLMTAKLVHSQLIQEAPCPFLGQAAFDTGSQDLHRCGQLSTASTQLCIHISLGSRQQTPFFEL